MIDWFNSLLWISFDFSTPIGEIGWIYVLIVYVIFKIVKAIAKGLS